MENQEEKTYNFTIEVKVAYRGYVVANNEQEAIQMIKDGEYNDIVDQYELDWDYDTLQLEEN